MDHGVVGIDSVANRRMTTGAVDGHGDKERMVSGGVLRTETTMAIVARIGAEITSGSTDQLAIAIVTGRAALMLHGIEAVHRHPGRGAGCPDVTEGTLLTHANLGEVADTWACPLMNGEPRAEVTGRAVPTSKLAGSRADQDSIIDAAGIGAMAIGTNPLVHEAVINGVKSTVTSVAGAVAGADDKTLGHMVRGGVT